MELVLAFIGCSVVGFSLTYWSNIKNSIQQQMTTSKSPQLKTLKGFVGKSLYERYKEAYEYLASEFGVIANVFVETTDVEKHIDYVKRYGCNQPKCLMPFKTYDDKDFMQHYITIADLYKEFQGDELIKKYLNRTESDLRNKVSQRLLELGITHKNGGNSSW